MIQSDGSQKPHRAQVFLWWVSGIAIICGGLWTLFTFVISPKTELPSDYRHKFDTLVQQVNALAEESDQMTNMALELEQLRREGENAEEQEKALEANVQSLKQEKATLYKELATLQEEVSKAKLTEREEIATKNKLQEARLSLDTPWLEPFSIWNSGDPIRILKDFGWSISSDNFYSNLGYYLNISHDKVLDGKNIIVSRIFELERLKKRQDDWRNHIQWISQRCDCPIIFLDESYYNYYMNELSEVGGVIYFADMTHSMHEPLSEWHKRLPKVLSGI